MFSYKHSMSKLKKRLGSLERKYEDSLAERTSLVDDLRLCNKTLDLFHLEYQRLIDENDSLRTELGQQSTSLQNELKSHFLKNLSHLNVCRKASLQHELEEIKYFRELNKIQNLNSNLLAQNEHLRQQISNTDNNCKDSHHFKEQNEILLANLADVRKEYEEMKVQFAEKDNQCQILRQEIFQIAVNKNSIMENCDVKLIELKESVEKMKTMRQTMAASFLLHEQKLQKAKDKIPRAYQEKKPAEEPYFLNEEKQQNFFAPRQNIYRNSKLRNRNNRQRFRTSRKKCSESRKCKSRSPSKRVESLRLAITERKRPWNILSSPISDDSYDKASLASPRSAISLGTKSFRQRSSSTFFNDEKTSDCAEMQEICERPNKKALKSLISKKFEFDLGKKKKSCENFDEEEEWSDDFTTSTNRKSFIVNSKQKRELIKFKLNNCKPTTPA